jgi:peptidoglycan/LPS O-acetylase OafA/YrhL
MRMAGRGGHRDVASVDSARSRVADGFGTLRLVIACGVIGLHAIPITGQYDGWGWGGSWYHFGTLTVAAFMAMSGFFVMKTWERDPHVGRFWVRRGLRIMPGLVVVLALSALVLGPLVTTLTPREYFADPDTWSYLVRNTLLFPQQYELPGVFANNAYPAAVNGSLWCLPVEVLGYAMVTLFGLLGIARRRALIFVVPLVFGTLLVLNVNDVVRLPQTTLLLLTNPLLQYLAIYAMGIAAWLYRDRIPLSWWGVLACVAVEIASYQTPIGDITRAVTMPYALLTVGTKLPRCLCLPQWLTVASFGVFIYGFPVEQTLAYLGADHTWQVIVFGVPTSIVLGLLSWHLVEKHGLRLRSALTGRGGDRDRRPVTVAVPPNLGLATDPPTIVFALDPPTVELPALRSAARPMTERRPVG